MESMINARFIPTDKPLSAWYLEVDSITPVPCTRIVVRPILGYEMSVFVDRTEYRAMVRMDDSMFVANRIEGYVITTNQTIKDIPYDAICRAEAEQIARHQWAIGS